MKSRPILFSAPMVRAILDGSKTQTVRVAKLVKTLPDGQGWDALQKPGTRTCLPLVDGLFQWKPVGGAPWEPYPNIAEYCPYGQAGDELWVRETFAQSSGDNRDEINGQGTGAVYRATWSGDSLNGLWKPSIHMPRWASRITLEITGVRIERLQDISEADATAEGVKSGMPCGCLDNGTPSCSAKCKYKALWESINGPGSWAKNPLVWIVEFRRAKP